MDMPRCRGCSRSAGFIGCAFLVGVLNRMLYFLGPLRCRVCNIKDQHSPSASELLSLFSCPPNNHLKLLVIVS